MDLSAMIKALVDSAVKNAKFDKSSPARVVAIGDDGWYTVMVNNIRYTVQSNYSFQIGEIVNVQALQNNMNNLTLIPRGGYGQRIEIGANGNWVINGEDTGQPSVGETPSIGVNDDGYIVIGGEPTDVNVNTDAWTIDENGYWVHNGVVTDIRAVAVDGINGDDCYFYIRYAPEPREGYSIGDMMTDTPQSDTAYMGTCSSNQAAAPTTASAYSWIKVKGATGASAKSLKLKANSMIFYADSNGTIEQPQSIVISTEKQNLTGNVNFLLSPVVAYTSGTDTVTIAATAFGSNDTLTITGTCDSMTDTLTIYKVKGGTNAYTVILSNEAHTIPCSSLGAPNGGELGSSGKAVSDVLVYKGATPLTPVGESATPTAGQYKYVIAATEGCSAERKDNNTFYISELTAASGHVDISVYAESGTSGFTKRMSWVKSCAGLDGTAGNSSYLHVKWSNDGGETFTVDSNGIASGEVIGDWLGILVDEIPLDSDNPSDYTWKRVTGEDTICYIDNGEWYIYGQATGITEEAAGAHRPYVNSTTKTWCIELANGTIHDTEMIANWSEIIDQLDETLASTISTIDTYKTDTDAVISAITTYINGDGLTEYCKQQLASLSLSSAEFSVVFSRLETLENTSNSFLPQIREYMTSITTNEDGIKIARSDSSTYCQIDNDSIDFYANNVLAATLSTEGLNVSSIKVNEDIILNNKWKNFVLSDGSLAWSWVGGVTS